MSLRCKIGLHGDHIYNYQDASVHCDRCGEDLGPTRGLFLAMDTTTSTLKDYNVGLRKDWEVATMIHHMWDEGRGEWEELYQEFMEGRDAR